MRRRWRIIDARPGAPVLRSKLIDLLARLTGRIWFWYFDDSGRRRLWWGRP